MIPTVAHRDLLKKGLCTLKIIDHDEENVFHLIA